MTTWTIAINGNIKVLGHIRTFATKKACQTYIEETYFGGLRDLCKIKPVKIKIDII